MAGYWEPKVGDEGLEETPTSSERDKPENIGL